MAKELVDSRGVSISAYNSQDQAAMGGFINVMAVSNPNHTEEFAFYVLLVVRDGKITYRYTRPLPIGSSGGGRISWRPIHGEHLRAYCHTHPKRIHDEKFGADDVEEFKNKNLIWYLLTPNEQIRIARTAADLPVGQDVTWLPAVRA